MATCNRSILTLRGFCLCLALVPLFFILQHVGPDGVPVAEGCGGGGNYIPPKYVSLSAPAGEGGAPESPSGRVTVATDGFFLMDTNVGTDPAAIAVTVKTADDVVVPGTVKVFTVDSGSVYYSWSANEPLALGAQLNVVMSPSGMPELASEAELEVVSAPAELSTGELTVESWKDIGRGTGPQVSCRVSSTCAGFSMITVSTGPEELLHAANYVWSPPRIDGFVLWEVEVERSGGAADAPDLGTSYPVLYTDRYPFGSVQVTYPKASDRYCAKVTVRDLRTGVEQAREQCFELGAPADTWHDPGVSLCSEAPVGFEAAWCKDRVDDPRCASVPGPSQPGPSQPEPSQPEPMATPTRSESSSCQMSPGSSRASYLGLFVAATALVGGLRRRRGTAR